MFAERGQRIVNILIGRDPNSPETKPCTWKLRFLYGALVGSTLATILWLVAVCANHWVYWEVPEGGVPRQGARDLLEAQYAGMWQICRVERQQLQESNYTSKSFKYCRPLEFFPTKEEIEQDPETDYTILNFRRAITAVGIIGLFYRSTEVHLQTPCRVSTNRMRRWNPRLHRTLPGDDDPHEGPPAGHLPRQHQPRPGRLLRALVALLRRLHRRQHRPVRQFAQTQRQTVGRQSRHHRTHLRERPYMTSRFLAGFTPPPRHTSSQK